MHIDFDPTHEVIKGTTQHGSKRGTTDIKLVCDMLAFFESLISNAISAFIQRSTDLAIDPKDSSSVRRPNLSLKKKN